MADVKFCNIFVITIIDQPLNRAAAEVYLHLYCLEQGLWTASYNEYIWFTSKRYFLQLLCIC